MKAIKERAVWISRVYEQELVDNDWYRYKVSITESPKKITVLDGSTNNTLKTFNPVVAGEEVVFFNSSDGLKEGVLGNVDGSSVDYCSISSESISTLPLDDSLPCQFSLYFWLGRLCFTNSGNTLVIGDCGQNRNNVLFSLSSPYDIHTVKLKRVLSSVRGIAGIIPEKNLIVGVGRYRITFYKYRGNFEAVCFSTPIVFDFSSGTNYDAKLKKIGNNYYLFVYNSNHGLYKFLVDPDNLTVTFQQNWSYRSNASSAFDFNEEGTELYFLEDNAIRRYSLSEPWNLGTVSGSSYTVYNHTEGSNLRNFTFSPDGSKLFLATTSRIKQFVMNVKYDFTTLEFESEFIFPNGDFIADRVPQGASKQGSKLLIYLKPWSDIYAQTVLLYDLNTSDLSYFAIDSLKLRELLPSTYSSVTSFRIQLAEEGTKLFAAFVHNSNLYLAHFELSVPYDVDSASLVNVNQVITGITEVNLFKLVLKRYLYFSGRTSSGSDSFYLVILNSDYDISTFSVASIGGLYGVAYATPINFSDDGKYVVYRGSDGSYYFAECTTPGDFRTRSTFSTPYRGDYIIGLFGDSSSGYGAFDHTGHILLFERGYSTFPTKVLMSDLVDDTVTGVIHNNCYIIQTRIIDRTCFISKSVDQGLRGWYNVTPIPFVDSISSYSSGAFRGVFSDTRMVYVLDAYNDNSRAWSYYIFLANYQIVDDKLSLSVVSYKKLSNYYSNLERNMVQTFSGDGKYAYFWDENQQIRRIKFLSPFDSLESYTIEGPWDLKAEITTSYTSEGAGWIQFSHDGYCCRFNKTVEDGSMRKYVRILYTLSVPWDLSSRVKVDEYEDYAPLHLLYDYPDKVTYYVGYNFLVLSKGIYQSDISSFNLTSPPEKAWKKPTRVYISLESNPDRCLWQDEDISDKLQNTTTNYFEFSDTRQDLLVPGDKLIVNGNETTVSAVTIESNVYKVTVPDQGSTITSVVIPARTQLQTLQERQLDTSNPDFIVSKYQPVTKSGRALRVKVEGDTDTEVSKIQVDLWTAE